MRINFQVLSRRPYSIGTDVSGLDIISLKDDFLHDFFSPQLRQVGGSVRVGALPFSRSGQALQHNGLQFDMDWKKLTNDAAIEMLRKVCVAADAAAPAVVG